MSVPRFLLQRSTQSVMAATVVIALLGGAYALGRSGGNEIPPIDARATGVQASAQPGNAQPSHGSRIEALKCEGCAVVLDVYTERHAGQASGLGAVGGAVVGGLLGSAVGKGDGKKLATVGGAVAGGYAGHEIEKRERATTVWVVRVADATGRQRRFERNTNPGLRAGDHVVVRDGELRLM
ncbi:glycine zipper 2TM domain-containing protein [Roseateles sp.]|uniref:glycine zipper 2TM domain-containing protein n=1 Tax=Roseateles sp. TaxID=1971397 RepID=UPI003925986A